jgi:outer membrane immunogenic protein
LHGGYSQAGQVARIKVGMMSRGSDIRLRTSRSTEGDKMRKFLLASSAIAALMVAAPAGAADMPVKARPLPPPPPPCAQFGGFYLGAHIGVVNVKRETTDIDFLWNGATTATTGSGAAGGIQGGYNWQARCAVWGFELDASWARDNNRDFHSNFPGFDFFLHRELKSFGTLRTRTGLVVDNVLLYVTGGLAWARINNSLSVDNLNNAFPALTASNDATRWGWTVGFGSEWAFGNGWSFKSEALYMQFEHKDFQLALPAGTGIAPAGTYRFTSDASAWVARIGFNYLFGGGFGKGPVVGRY